MLPTEDDWWLLLRRIRDGECVPFLGSGASLGYDEGPNLPTAGELSETLAVECNYPGADRWDLLRVAQVPTSPFATGTRCASP